ncbi:mitochondrial import inner membrane translocase subunit tim54, partial [Linderina macrospora]
YNKKESKRRLDYYCSRAAHVANEPIGALETPRKVHVYIAAPMGELGTRKARMHFEEYILPVFVAGALDYELTLVNDTETVDDVEKVVRGGVHSQIAEEIKERRRKQLEATDETGVLKMWRETIDERAKENEQRDARNKRGENPGEAAVPELGKWKPEPYPGIMDVVAIGRVTWVEAINGISEGALGSLNRTVPPLVKIKAEEQEAMGQPDKERRIDTTPVVQGEGSEAVQVTDTAGTIVESSESAPRPVTAPEPTPVVVNYDEYASQATLAGLPAVAYISHMNLTGWGSVPLKIWNFFHDQQNVDRYSSQALQVVFESTRRRTTKPELETMGSAEEALEAWEGQHMDVVVEDNVAGSLMIYDTQVDNAPFKSDE